MFTPGVFTLYFMKTQCFGLTILALLLAVTVRAEQRVESHTWEVAQTPMIKLETFRGSIRVEQGAAEQVVVVLKAEASGPEAQQWLEKVQVVKQAFGAGLAIAVKHDSSGIEVNLGGAPVRTVDVIVRVPRTCSLDVRSESGSIEIGHDLIGRVRARAISGDVFIGRIDGDIDAETRFGNVTVARATGKLSARSLSGDVTVGTIMGDAVLRTANGNIEVMSSQGGLDAEATSGDVAAGFARRIERDVAIKAKVGDIRVAVDPDTALQLDARVSWGQIRSGLDFEPMAQAALGKHRLQGLRNGGGPLLALNASGGDVRIDSVPTFEAEMF